MRPRLVLFDIDGTLVTPRGLGRRSLEAAFTARYGSSGVFEGVPFHGRTDFDIIDEGIGRVRGSLDDRLAIVRDYLDQLKVEVVSGPPLILPGVPQLLPRLEAAPGVTLGLVTGNVREGARIKLARDGMFDCFHTGAFGDDHRDRRELARLAVKRAQELRGVRYAAQDVFLIGDTRNDVLAARAAGAVAIAVATGGETAESLAASQPDHVLTSLDPIDSFLNIVFH